MSTKIESVEADSCRKSLEAADACLKMYEALGMGDVISDMIADLAHLAEERHRFKQVEGWEYEQSGQEAINTALFHFLAERDGDDFGEGFEYGVRQP